MIGNREELEYSIKAIAKMYDLRDRDAAEALYHPSTRASVVESTNSMIRKIEREVAEYLATHPEEFRDEHETVAPAREPVAA